MEQFAVPLDDAAGGVLVVVQGIDAAEVTLAHLYETFDVLRQVRTYLGFQTVQLREFRIRYHCYSTFSNSISLRAMARATTSNPAA